MGIKISCAFVELAGKSGGMGRCGRIDVHLLGCLKYGLVLLCATTEVLVAIILCALVGIRRGWRVWGPLTGMLVGISGMNWSQS